MNLWDVRLTAGKRARFDLRDGDTAALFLLKGVARIVEGEQSGQPIGEAELAIFEREGDAIAIEAVEDTSLLLMSGTPIDEPVVGYGPFVMNSEDEIRQAITDYQSGKMGRLAERI